MAKCENLYRPSFFEKTKNLSMAKQDMFGLDMHLIS